jgi:hypothetical protein
MDVPAMDTDKTKIARFHPFAQRRLSVVMLCDPRPTRRITGAHRTANTE